MSEYQPDLTRFQRWVREASDGKWSWHRMPREVGKPKLPEMAKKSTKQPDNLEEVEP